MVYEPSLNLHVRGAILHTIYHILYATHFSTTRFGAIFWAPYEEATRLYVRSGSCGDAFHDQGWWLALSFFLSMAAQGPDT